MDTSQQLLEILKFTIPSLTVLAVTYIIINKFLVAQTQRQQMAIFEGVQDTTIKLRLQAYERLILFVERISPRQMLPRVYDSSLTVADLRQLITMTIMSEYEYNLSQQIYVSKNVWETIRNVKEQEINMVNKLAAKFDPAAPAKELYTKILDIVLQADGEIPTDVAVNIINTEVRRVMSYGSY